MKTKSIKIKVVAMSLAALTAFGSIAPYYGEGKVAQAAETHNRFELDDYLKSIAPENKQSLLVDKGTGIELDAKNKNEIEDIENDGIRIIRRTKETAEGGGAEIGMINGNLNGVFPGAILHADSKLVDGTPTMINGGLLSRKPLMVSVDINGNTQDPVTVENPNMHNVPAAVNRMVDNWLESGKKTAAQLKYKSVMVNSEKQLDAELGVAGAADKYSVDVKACTEGKKKQMIVLFNQTYYTARVEAQTASQLFTDDVTVDDLKRVGIDENNPGVAEVTSIDFGRQIVVKLSSDNASESVEAAWKASVGTNGITGKADYKSVMDETTFEVFAFGGAPEAAGQLITTTKDIDEVNKIIASDINFTKDSAAKPISYSTNFIDDASQARISRSTEYVKTSAEVHKKISVHLDTANAYDTKKMEFWVREITGIDDNGNIQLSGWKNKLNTNSTGNQDFSLSGRCAEFGFGFDVTWGTDWPYSDVFWRLNDGVAEKIYIDMGGTVRTPSIDIKVNDTSVYKNGNCDSHSAPDFH